MKKTKQALQPDHRDSSVWKKPPCMTNMIFFLKKAVSNRKARRTRPPSSFLPEELVFDILVRIPEKTLLRFNCLSASIHNLIQSPYFLDARADHLTKNESISFKFAELRRATKSFRETNILGEGDFATVYKGTIPRGIFRRGTLGGQVVAIKKLKWQRLEALKDAGVKGFLDELEILKQMKHPNIIKLLGYCVEGKGQHAQHLLVLEYASRGSLYEILQTKDGRDKLTWKMRMKIAADIAKGLEYVHRKKGKIHRDVKSSNILLTEDWQAKLADFGTVRDGPDEAATHVTTPNATGTKDYMSFEYFVYCHLRYRTDIWKFGCIVLELIYGKKAPNLALVKDNRLLALWAARLFEDREDHTTERTMVDPSLNGQYKEIEMRQALGMCQECLLGNPELVKENITSLATGFSYLADIATPRGPGAAVVGNSWYTGKIYAEKVALGSGYRGKHTNELWKEWLEQQANND
ncbi:Probable serine/threonine-protein kinase PBL5 [Linum grandiflorum]